MLKIRLLIKIYFIFQSFYCTCHPIFEETQLWWFGFGLGISQMLASWLQNRACFWQKGFCWLGTRTLKSIKKRRYLHCCLECKFDNTRLSYWHKNQIGRIEIFFCCFLPLQIFCPGSLLSKVEQANRAENLQSQEATKKNFNSANLILMSIGKSGIIKFEFQTT